MTDLESLSHDAFLTWMHGPEMPAPLVCEIEPAKRFSKTRALRPGLVYEWVLAVRVDFYSGSRFLKIEPEATWADLHAGIAAVMPMSDRDDDWSFLGLHEFWVREDRGKASPEQGRFHPPFFEGVRIISERLVLASCSPGDDSLLEDSVEESTLRVCDTVSHEHFALYHYRWSVGRWAELTFFAAPPKSIILKGDR